MSSVRFVNQLRLNTLRLIVSRHPSRERVLLTASALLWVNMLALPLCALAKIVTPPSSTPLKNPGPKHLVTPTPKIVSVSPAMGTGGSVTIKGNVPLGSAKTIYFGSQSVQYFGVNNDGSLTATMPYGLESPGNVIPVSVLLSSGTTQTVAFGDATYTVPLGYMGVTGPLPWNPQAGDYAWVNGQGRSFSLGAPKALTYTTMTPVLHISAGFTNQSTQYPETKGPPYGPNSNVGNVGKFSAKLESCVPAANAGDGACTGWDNSPGMWESVGNPVSLTLNMPASGDASGDIALPMGPLFSEQNLAATVRTVLQLTLSDTETPGNPIRNANYTSAPANVVVVPIAFMQAKLIPLGIVYAPPGDMSSVTFTTNDNYNVNYVVGQSNSQTNKDTGTNAGSWNVSMTEGYDQASNKATVTWGDGESWDTSVSQGFGVQTNQNATTQYGQGIGLTYGIGGNVGTTPGNGLVCATSTNCATTALAPGWFESQPFWNDEFVLLIHPQYALYVIGKGTNRTALYGSVAATASPTVLDLYKCATGALTEGLSSCVFGYSGFGITNINQAQYKSATGKVTLTVDEAKRLLQLDPFYAALSQGATLDATRAAPIKTVSYGSFAGTTSQYPVVVTYNNNQVTTTTSGGQTSYTASVTNTQTSTTSLSGSGQVSYYVTLGLTGTESTVQTGTSEFDTQVAYSNSTAVSDQLVTTASVTLNDVDNQTQGPSGVACKACHNPLPSKPTVNVFLDKMFGGFMFQDASSVSSNKFSAAQATAALKLLDLDAMTQTQEARIQRFSDVPNGTAGKVAIGILTRVNIMTGYADGTFKPSEPFTRGQLAVALATALKLPATPGQSQFTDVASTDALAAPASAAAKAGLLVLPSATTLKPSDPVTRQELATSLVRAFKATKAAAAPSDASQVASWATDSVRLATGAGYMQTFADGTFKPTAPMTRSDAAQAILSAVSQKH
ncbi:S-layer homology domain-containing protein [Paraburkholderia susongensis]|uniref:S-layer homology domain-containing protein n=1 Tax=Paraburkholderia susongensis TaxID=1515439 RepID=A0A1X7L5G3_9BURK|nr:S-layer homology domain-containing protein [Paraburkholderia susongensis]SMG49020.1 S-layer homology domain-containing protein [Paraburkholderia susongensis]